MFDVGEKLTVTIEKLAFQGLGIAKPDDFAVFVPRTVPGDVVDIEITVRKKNFAHARTLALTRASEDRQQPKCRHFDQCGGCHYQHIADRVVSREKRQQLLDTFERMGPGQVDLRPTIEGSNRWEYRNRAIYRRSASGEQGYVSWQNFQTVDIDSCPITVREINRVWNELRTKIAHISSKVMPFVTLRKIGSKVAVIFSVSSEFSPQELVKILDRTEEVVYYTTTIASDSKVAFGKSIQPLFEAPIYLEHSLGDLFYILRPDLFFQVNDHVARQMIDLVTSEIESRVDPVLDIYCGSGLFTLALAKKGISSLGIEVQYAAIQCAEQGALRNGVEEFAKFRAGKADRILDRLAKEGYKYERVIVDPPRNGLDPKILDHFEKLNVREIFYVSCSPPTLARDMKDLQQRGYNVAWCQPFEMFPQTYHIETVSKISK